MNPADESTFSVRTITFRAVSLLGAVLLLLSIGVGTSAAATQQTAPIVPNTVSDETHDDYEASVADGRGNTLAKVGDSNTAFAQNLYALGCRANLNLSSPALQGTADFYKATSLPASDSYCGSVHNSFTRYSAATRGGGWSVLPLVPSGTLPQSGGWFLRDSRCSSDTEIVLACEIRLANSRYTLIGGGSNDFAWGLPVAEQKDRFLDLIEAARDNASIPVLQTIPPIVASNGDTSFTADLAGKVESMNQSILDAGDEAGVPVINLWKAMQPLPNKGLAPDGIHLSAQEGSNQADTIFRSGNLSSSEVGIYGANARNFYVLKTLAFLDDELEVRTDPPSSMNYDSISAGTTTLDSIQVSTGISGTIPSGATSVMTKAAEPRGTTPSVPFSASVGNNTVNFTGLASATTYYFRAITKYGTPPNETTVASSEISATTKGAPETTITTAVPNDSADDRSTSRLDFKSSVHGPGTSFECSLDGAPFTACAPPMTYSSLKVGSHTFSVKAINQGTDDPSPATKTWTVDAPNVTITAGPAEGSITSDDSPSFTSASTEPTVLGGVTYTLKHNGSVVDSGWSGPTKAFAGLPDGEYEFTTNWLDSAGNVGDPVPPVRTWTIDRDEKDPPNVTIKYGTGPDEGWPTKDRNPSFTSESTEPTVLGGIVYSLKHNGSEIESGWSAATKSFSGLADGDYEFSPNWVDRAGNLDPTPPVRKWTIDNAPPTTTIDSGPANSSKSNDDSPVFTFSSNESPVRFECRIWQGFAVTPFEPCTSPKSYSGLPDNAVWAFQVRATDLAGNTDPTTAVRIWEIDTVPPNVTITAGPAQHSVTTDRNPSFTSASTEPTVLGGITYILKRNGSVYEQGFSGPTKAFSDLPPGDYEFTPNWQDEAGNVDPTPPVRSWTIQ